MTRKKTHQIPLPLDAINKESSHKNPYIMSIFSSASHLWRRGVSNMGLPPKNQQ
jgi:hypothetical protein